MVAEVQKFQRQIERHHREHERLRQWERRKSLNNGLKSAASMDSLLMSVKSCSTGSESDYGKERYIAINGIK